MSKAGIAWVIEQEAILVSLLGVSVGIALTFAARLGVMRMTTLVIDVEARWVLIALLVGLVGGSVGALYPAVRAARQDAVDALSYE
jgi:putative ABC transport system permease protein